jgi:hypothetical protein
MNHFIQVHSLLGNSLQQSFEGFAEVMSSLPGMYFELDGSFVWVEQAGSQLFQMDGMVYDKEGRIVYVEIKGCISKRQWRTLCNALCNASASTDSSKAEWDAHLRVQDVLPRVWMTASQVLAQCS